MPLASPLVSAFDANAETRRFRGVAKGGLGIKKEGTVPLAGPLVSALETGPTACVIRTLTGGPVSGTGAFLFNTDPHSATSASLCTFAYLPRALTGRPASGTAGEPEMHAGDYACPRPSLAHQARSFAPRIY